MSFTQANTIGTLYVVATPIGHLKDITYRAVEVLGAVDYIACEDTRHSRKLLEKWSIKTPTFAYHDHNEQNKINQIVRYLQEGKNIALVSDAGTPLICDPGHPLLQTLKSLQIPVVPIPGASAFVCALQGTSLAKHRFCFEGYLPPKTQSRQHALQALKDESRLMIFYEAPHRILATLEDCIGVFGSARQGAIAKELSKMHETIVEGDLESLRQWCALPARQKGEFVLMVAGQRSREIDHKTEQLLTRLLAEMPIQKAVKILQEFSEFPRNSLYNLALSIQKK